MSNFAVETLRRTRATRTYSPTAKLGKLPRFAAVRCLPWFTCTYPRPPCGAGSAPPPCSARSPKSLVIQHIHLPILSARRRQRGQRCSGRSNDHDMIRRGTISFPERSIQSSLNEQPAPTLTNPVPPLLLDHGLQHTYHLTQHSFVCTIGPRRIRN